MTCKHILLSQTNIIDLATLESSHQSDTPLDNLKNEFRGQQTRWSDFSSIAGLHQTVITGTFETDQFIDYMAIVGSDFGIYGPITWRFELYSDAGPSGQIYNSGDVSAGSVLPLGAWSIGTDPYGDTSTEPMNDIYSRFFDDVKKIRAFRIVIIHNFNPSGSSVSNNIPVQDASGIVSIEAEAGTLYTSTGVGAWSVISDTGASGNQALYKSSGYNAGVNEGPRADYVMTATQSGLHWVWMLVAATDVTKNSIYATFNGDVSTIVFDDLGTAYEWKKSRLVTFVDGQKYTLSISGRDAGVKIDKIAIQPINHPDPTGSGPAVSSFGTMIDGADTNKKLSLRMLMMGRSLALQKNMAYGNSISFLTPPDLYQTISGNPVPGYQQSKVRRFEFSLPHMTDSDRFNVWRLETQNLGRPFLINAYPSAPEWQSANYQMLARLENPLTYTHRQNNRHETTVVAREA